jgi:hypothetical protein
LYTREDAFKNVTTARLVFINVTPALPALRRNSISKCIQSNGLVGLPQGKAPTRHNINTIQRADGVLEKARPVLPNLFQIQIFVKDWWGGHPPKIARASARAISCHYQED